MAVDLDGQLGHLLQRRNQIIGGIWCQQAGHVLDGDAVDAHLLQFAGNAHVLLDRIRRRDGVDDASLRVAAQLLGRPDGPFDIAHVIESIEDTNDVDAVLQ